MIIPRKGDVWIVSLPSALPYTASIAAIAWLPVNADWPGDDRSSSHYERPCVIWDANMSGVAAPLRVKRLLMYGRRALRGATQ